MPALQEEILIVDEPQSLSSQLPRMLKKQGWSVAQATTMDAVAEFVSSRDIPYVLCNISNRDLRPHNIMREMVLTYQKLPCVVGLARKDQQRVAIEEMILGLFDILMRPVLGEQLVNLLLRMKQDFPSIRNQVIEKYKKPENLLTAMINDIVEKNRKTLLALLSSSDEQAAFAADQLVNIYSKQLDLIGNQLEQQQPLMKEELRALKTIEDELVVADSHYLRDIEKRLLRYEGENAHLVNTLHQDKLEEAYHKSFELLTRARKPERIAALRQKVRDIASELAAYGH